MVEHNDKTHTNRRSLDERHGIRMQYKHGEALRSP